MNNELQAKYDRLYNAILYHHAQRADDRCVLDDDKLYEAADLPPVDRRVGDKFEMLKNCARFIEKRCEEGGWPTYRELEEKLEKAKVAAQELLNTVAYERFGGSTSTYAYFWEKNWEKIKAQLEEILAT